METRLKTSVVQNDAGLWVAETVARLGLAEVEERPYQAEALQALWDARANGANRGLVHLATGLGKTSVATLDVLRFGEAEFRGEEGQKPRVLFACHKEEILEQAADRFTLFTPDASQGFYVGRRRELDADITFATMQSLFRRLGDLAQSYFDYVIYDEAHHAKAATFERVVEHFGPAFKLGLTATPNRADELDIREFFGSELYSKSLAEGMAEGWLAHPDYHIVFDDAVRKAIESNFDPKSLKELRALLKVDVRNEVIVGNIKDKLKELGAEDAKTIVFCEDIEHVDEIAEGLGGGSYHSKADKSEREELLARFKDGSLQFICTRDMFNEGVDIPDAEVLVFLRGTGSQTVFEQQLGRGLRRIRGKKDKVVVLDFVANIERVQAVATLSRAVAEAEKSVEEKATDWDSEEVGENGESSAGFSVHTAHGDFEFDSLAVEVLGRFNSLKDIDIPLGFTSVKEAASELGIDGKTLVGLCEHYGWVLPDYRHSRGSGLYLSPEQLGVLRQHPEVSTQKAEGDMYSFNTLSKETGISPDSLEKMIEEQGWDLPLRKFGPKITRGITSLQVSILRSVYPDMFVEIAPEGWLSLKRAAKEIGVDYYRAKRLVADSSFEYTWYKSEGGGRAKMLSPEQIEELRCQVNSDIIASDVGAISFADLSVEVDLPPATLKRYAREAGIIPGKYRFGKSRTNGEGLTVEQAKVLKDDPRISNFAPDGYSGIDALAEELGIYPQPLRVLVKQKGWKLTKFRGRGKGTRVSGMLSPEQIEVLKSDPKIKRLL